MFYSFNFLFGFPGVRFFTGLREIGELGIQVRENSYNLGISSFWGTSHTDNLLQFPVRSISTVKPFWFFYSFLSLIPDSC